jgi:cytidylate kinase
MAKFVVTIDGPAASGKSTAARLLAKRLGAVFLDTGAMYRAVTLAALNAGIDMKDQNQLLLVLDKTDFDFTAEDDRMTVKINGMDVTEQIRSPKVTDNAHYVASSAKLRQRLVRMQRDFAGRGEKIVTEGRDQGTVVFPDADVKFYLDAGIYERARRRQAELTQKGIEADIKEIKRAIEKRDTSDAGRSVGPLKPADDAIVVDTTGLNIDEVVKTLADYVTQICSKKD